MNRRDFLVLGARAAGASVFSGVFRGTAAALNRRDVRGDQRVPSHIGHIQLVGYDSDD